jgi:hypothetical protein
MRPDAISQSAVGRACRTFTPPRREQRIGAEAPERIGLVAKLDVRRKRAGKGSLRLQMAERVGKSDN